MVVLVWKSEVKVVVTQKKARFLSGSEHFAEDSKMGMVVMDRPFFPSEEQKILYWLRSIIGRDRSGIGNPMA
jgi:hypothetical protein